MSRPSFYGVVIDRGKNERNLGTVWRTAVNFGAAFTGQIGGRYARTAGDTVNAAALVPHHTYVDAIDWVKHIPEGCTPVAVEVGTPVYYDLGSYQHPAQAVYVFGPEDGSISTDVLAACDDVVRIPSTHCLNQAVAAAVVMWDRISKGQT